MANGRRWGGGCDEFIKHHEGIIRLVLSCRFCVLDRIPCPHAGLEPASLSKPRVVARLRAPMKKTDILLDNAVAAKTRNLSTHKKIQCNWP